MNTTQLTLVAKVKDNEPRIDSRLIAKGLDISHNHVIEQIEKYQSKLSTLGIVRFETEKISNKRGRPERITYLNENQCYAMVTLSKNTDKAVALKFALVEAFAEAREALNAHKDYLPSYHGAHQSLGLLVRLCGSSQPESTHHRNLEKMINKALDLPSGCRKQLPPATRSAVAVAERVAKVAYDQALTQGQDHKTAYKLAKAGVNNYADTIRHTLPSLEVAA